MAEISVEVFMSQGSRNVLVGYLYGHRRGGNESATFVYADSWLSWNEQSELEPGLPLLAGQQQTPVGQTLFGIFTDSAPDRWGRRLIARNEKRRVEYEGGTARSIGEMDYLLGVRDDVRQGALRFRDPLTGQYLSDTSSGIPHLIELGKLLSASVRLENDAANDADLRLLLHAGSSLGGARPKAHVIDVSGKLAIAKFPSAVLDDWDVMAWEQVLLSLARQSGIHAPRSRVESVQGQNVLIIDRFDRDGELRHSYASAMTMLEATDGDQRSYLEIAEVVEVVSTNPADDLEELWRRIAFFILVGNTDDHLRNHGFIRPMGERGWKLSPVFDVNPNPLSPAQMTTSIDGGDPVADIDVLMDVAEWFRLKRSDACRILGEVERATSQWSSAARRIGLERSQIKFMNPAFEHDQRVHARSLSA